MTTLKEAITERGLRKDWVADKLGVCPATLSRYLKGVVPKKEIQQRALEFFGISPEHLFSKSPVSTTCKYCGITFSREKVITDKKYCSTDCRFKSMRHSQEVAFKYYKRQCRMCGSTKPLHVHHVSGLVYDNTPENLMVLCSSCHKTIHDLIRKHHKGQKYSLKTIKYLETSV